MYELDSSKNIVAQAYVKILVRFIQVVLKLLHKLPQQHCRHRASVEPRPQSKLMVTDFGLNPYSCTFCHCA